MLTIMIRSDTVLCVCGVYVMCMCVCFNVQGYMHLLVVASTQNCIIPDIQMLQSKPTEKMYCDDV